MMSVDHGKLLGNTIKWALNEEPVVLVEGSGVVDVTAWKQKNSMTVHLVNLTNPMMMKGPFREFIPVAAKTKIKIPANKTVSGVQLIMANQKPRFTIDKGVLTLDVPKIVDHEIVAIDLT
jgi:hypothetical protein